MTDKTRAAAHKANGERQRMRASDPHQLSLSVVSLLPHP